MYTKNKKYKIAAILGIIACSITIITGFINFFAVAVIDTFFQLFDEMLAVVIDQSTGTTYYDLILQLGIMTIDEFRTLTYILVLVMYGLLIFTGIIGLLLSIFSVKDGSLNRQEFQKRNVKHVFFLIFMGLLAFSIAGDIPVILSLVAFVLGLIDVINNKKVLKIHNVTSETNFYENAGEENFYNYKKNPVPEEKKEDVIEIVETEEEKKARQIKLEEAFELLSKLEKSYKTGEIDEDNYKRMKETIMNF